MHSFSFLEAAFAFFVHQVPSVYMILVRVTRQLLDSADFVAPLPEGGPVHDFLHLILGMAQMRIDPGVVGMPLHLVGLSKFFLQNS